MSEKELASRGAPSIEQALVQGNLAGLNPEQRVQYYLRVCDSLGLNPHTQPFDYITLNGKLRLYALRTATDQLRKINGVSVTAVREAVTDDVLTVTVEVSDKEGRRDLDTGCVSLAGLKGEALANARMKALTKAKRRATLSLCGLGWLDETEAESVRAVAAARVEESPPERPALPAPGPTITPPEADGLAAGLDALGIAEDDYCAAKHLAELCHLPAKHLAAARKQIEAWAQVVSAYRERGKAPPALLGLTTAQAKGLVEELARDEVTA